MNPPVSRHPIDSVFSHRNLPLLLLHARERVIARARPILHKHGLTEQQWRIVRALLDSGPVEQREVVVLCGISNPSLAGILGRMEEMELVMRERLDYDQRRVRVSLTAKGRAVAARIAPKIEMIYVDIESRVGPDFMKQFYQMLDALIAASGDPDDEAPGRSLGATLCKEPSNPAC